jgi:transcriptional regulator with XRE-family HTH domain
MNRNKDHRRKDGDPMLDILRTYRKACGLSIRDAAKRMKVNKSTVQAWEAGVNKPQPRMITKIAGLYRIDPMKLVEWIEPPRVGSGIGV